MKREKEVEALKLIIAENMAKYSKAGMPYEEALKMCALGILASGFGKVDELNAEIAGLTGKVEALQQDNENLRRTLEEGAESDETSFERYLLDKLLHSAEDYCAYCVRGQSEEPCLENGDDCRAGIRAFYERFVEGK